MKSLETLNKVDSFAADDFKALFMLSNYSKVELFHFFRYFQ